MRHLVNAITLCAIIACAVAACGRKGPPEVPQGQTDTLLKRYPNQE